MTTIEREQVGVRIRHLRRKVLGMTQQEFADSIHVHPITVVRWENGYVDPATHNLQAMAKLGKVPVSWFFASDDRYFTEAEELVS